VTPPLSLRQQRGRTRTPFVRVMNHDRIFVEDLYYLCDIHQLLYARYMRLAPNISA
jgi:hypothetical protein